MQCLTFLKCNFCVLLIGHTTRVVVYLSLWGGSPPDTERAIMDTLKMWGTIYKEESDRLNPDQFLEREMNCALWWSTVQINCRNVGLFNRSYTFMIKQGICMCTYFMCWGKPPAIFVYWLYSAPCTKIVAIIKTKLQFIEAHRLNI